MSQIDALLAEAAA
jgi:CheY-like chemotaxis protein